MEKINGDLLDRIQKKLSVSRSRVYARIDAKGRQMHLPRNIAAFALATESGINISRFATAEELSILRHAASGHHSAITIPFPSPSSMPSPVKASPKKKATGKRALVQRNTVFVVHGRNSSIRQAMFEFLRSVGLHPLEWNTLLKKTKKGSPYLGDILETALDEASAVVVLLTPDDTVKLKDEFISGSDPVHEKTFMGQARPNVLFEAGMAFGRYPKNTILIQFGGAEIKPFSDVAGRHLLHMDNSPGRRKELITKLSNAGCTVDETGTDWISAGNFALLTPKKKKIA